MPHWVAFILLGLVAGWATGKIMKGGGYGFIVDILLGIAGSVVGGYIAVPFGFWRWGADLQADRCDCGRDSAGFPLPAHHRQETGRGLSPGGGADSTRNAFATPTGLGILFL